MIEIGNVTGNFGLGPKLLSSSFGTAQMGKVSAHWEER
jgi:hypothetical protein